MINIGEKYQMFDNDTRKIYRMSRYDKDSNLVFMIDTDTKKEKDFTVAEVQNMVKLTPDATLDLMITSYDNNDKDVYACVYRTDKIMNGITDPVLILRQDVYSYTKNPFATDNRVYTGDCITEYTLPPDLHKVSEIADFSKVDYDYALYLYTDDTMDDIFDLIPQHVQFKFNKILKSLARKNTNIVTGYCKDLKSLFEDNRFIDNYRLTFNITQVDFPIILGKESFNDKGDIILNSKQKKRIEDMIRKYITNVIVIEYDYDIDISDIVKYKHILISDSTQKIFLIAYEVSGDYPIDPDIAKAMNVRS